MSDEDHLPEFDCVPGAPHPRMTQNLFGQERAEFEFLEAYNTERLHHGWLITGPRGIGKATLAWRIAKFLVTHPIADAGGLFGSEPQAAVDLSPIPDHPALSRIESLGEPSIMLLRPQWDADKKRFKQGITVDEARKLKSFFQLSAADGGRRVVIVDSADDLNVAAANALLKVLEEPPSNVVLLLISHQPSRLLPTIRSRCRELRCAALNQEDIAGALEQVGAETAQNAYLSVLAGGSVGHALRMEMLDGVATYQNIVTLLSQSPDFDRAQASKFAEIAGARTKPEMFDLCVDLLDLFLSRLARVGATGQAMVEAANDEMAVLHRLCPSPSAAREWARLQQELGQRARAGKAVNLDASALILDMLLKINEHAARMVR